MLVKIATRAKEEMTSPPVSGKVYMASQLTDAFARKFYYLRLSITDVCNFRCTYCLPDGYKPGGVTNNGFLTVDEIRRVNEYQVIPLHWRVSNSEDEVSKRIYFDAALKINQNLTDEQISDLIFIVRDTQAGFEYIEQRNGYTLLFVVVQSRDQIATLIQRLRTFLGYPNIVRLYQWNDEVLLSQSQHTSAPKNKDIL